MQTVKRWDPPRNRRSYPIDPHPSIKAIYRTRACYWCYMNAAEYWRWCASHDGWAKVWEPILCSAERAAAIARARTFLRAARWIRTEYLG
jgi:hypothetical protein